MYNRNKVKLVSNKCKNVQWLEVSCSYYLFFLLFFLFPSLILLTYSLNYLTATLLQCYFFSL